MLAEQVLFLPRRIKQPSQVEAVLELLSTQFNKLLHLVCALLQIQLTSIYFVEGLEQQTAQQAELVVFLEFKAEQVAQLQAVEVEAVALILVMAEPEVADQQTDTALVAVEETLAQAMVVTVPLA
jgi:hypothetical protein